MIRVYIVNDYPLLLQGLRTFIDGQKDMKVVGYALSASVCREYFSKSNADVVLISFHFRDDDNLKLCADITINHPSIAFLELNTTEQGFDIKQLMNSEANGYTSKNAGKTGLIKALHAVSKNK